MTNDNPREMTRVEYESIVESDAEAALTALDEYPEDFNNLHEAVEYAVDGSRMVNHRGNRLITLFHTRQNPDNPDYEEGWNDRVSTTDLTHDDALTQMAHVCYLSDVMNQAKELLEEREAETGVKI